VHGVIHQFLTFAFGAIHGLSDFHQYIRDGRFSFSGNLSHQLLDGRLPFRCDLIRELFGERNYSDSALTEHPISPFKFVSTPLSGKTA
jgi:hypothetical protein